MSVLRKCVCCGKEYDYCPACPKKDQPGWMATFCSEPCKELFNIVSAYNTKRIGKDAVRKFVIEHKVDVSKYLAPVQKVLNEANEEPKVEKPLEDTKVVRPITRTSKLTSEDTKSDSSSTPGSTYDHRARRNKKRRTRQLDIELK